MRTVRLLLIPVVVGILTTLLHGWEVGVFAGLLVGVVAGMLEQRNALDWLYPKDEGQP